MNKDGKKTGLVCSGTYSPNLKTGVGMAYVHKDDSKVFLYNLKLIIKFLFLKNGNKLKALVRGREIGVTVTKMPFVPSKYHKI